MSLDSAPYTAQSRTEHKSRAEVRGFRRATALAWILMAVPFVAYGVWIPVTRALGLTGGPGALLVILSCVAAALGGGLVRPSPPGWALLMGAGMASGLCGGMTEAALLHCGVLLASWFATQRLVDSMTASLPTGLDDVRGWRFALWAVGILVSVLQVARVAVFMADPSFAIGNLIPGDHAVARHSCLSAYLHGALLATEGANPYDLKYDTLALGPDAPLPHSAAFISPFTLDAFAYSPAFLLLPMALRSVSTDFLIDRALFAAGSMVIWSLCLWWLLTYLDHAARRRVVWLAPLFTAGTTVLLNLQFCNFNLVLVAMCAAVWMQLERGQDSRAGLVLAAATLTRYSPGLLGVIMLVQRRYRAIGWTVAWAVGLVLLSLMTVGAGPWKWFVTYELPILRAGRALGFLDGDPFVAQNLAPFGIPFKLQRLGLEHFGWAQASLVDSVYTALIILAAYIAGRRSGPAAQRLISWLAIAGLASLKSSFAGAHVIPNVALLLLILATELKMPRQVVVFVLLILLASVPLNSDSVALEQGYSLFSQAVLLIVLFWAAVRRPVRVLSVSHTPSLADEPGSSTGLGAQVH